MSGDVQPRKRKDKKKRKDELGLDEPRGTAAALGEGDVFIHSYQDHSTGGHWCAKIIFFSLLAVLATLIGLIILENRGLSELEANSVESRYSGVLEGWIEDPADDDHHDEHTLELKHPDDDDDEHEIEDDEEMAHSDEEDHDGSDHDEEDETDDHHEDPKDDIDDDKDNEENEDEEENYEHDDEEEHEEEADDDDDGEEVERLEREVSDEDVISETNADEDENNENSEEDDNTADDDEPPVERITIPPPGKPFTEIEEEVIQKTPDTLAEEEEYEKQQEELKREQEAQSSQGMWLKLVVGGALLAATHAVVRRATAPRDEADTEEDINEEPSVIDRRMTLIAQKQEIPEITRPVTQPKEEIIQKPITVAQSIPITKPKADDDSTLENIVKKEIEEKFVKDEEEKELYSDEDEEEEEEEEEEDDEEEVKEEIVKKPEVKEVKAAPVKQPSPEPPEDEDVEIIDEEDIEEELEDEEVEEEISDVDDTDLLSRLDAKYGRLPEPERPGNNKGGGNSIEDDWPGEPNDPYWSQQLDLAEEELRQGSWSACEKRVSAPELRSSARAQWLAAKSLDLLAEAKRDNRLLSRAVAAYLHLLKTNDNLPDKKLVEVAQRAIDRIQFRGTYLNAEPVYRLLIRRFPDNVNYRNNLTICFLMANRNDLADKELKETLRLWPNDRVALAHYGFVLKNHHNKIEESVKYLEKALEGDTGAANEPRFYYHLGDALLLLGKFKEAHEVHKRGAALGHFLSPAQRSLYNVKRLKSRPWWPVEATPYTKLAKDLESNWREILKEGMAAKTLYEQEKEGLKEKGEWSQLDIFVRGQEIPGRCKKAPVTCSIVRKEPAAGCKRGQVKFSLIEPGTHVRPHVGPTNCRLRMHLGLSNTKDTYIRVDQEIRQWEIGKVFIFDDSFEHEVWHNGTGARLVLIVDVWHPDLTLPERRALPAI